MTAQRQCQFFWVLGDVTIGTYALLLSFETITQTGNPSLTNSLIDGLLMILTGVSPLALALLGLRHQRLKQYNLLLARDLEAARSHNNLYRSATPSSHEPSKAIVQRQFRAWGMTAAECEIGFHIIKGLRHREIAKRRGTSEGTVRQQAHAIYKKSSLPGKAAFAGHFLDDVIVCSGVRQLSQNSYCISNPRKTALSASLSKACPGMNVPTTNSALRSSISRNPNTRSMP